MPRKCCVFGCRTNYDSEKLKNDGKKLSVFRLPSHDDEREKWVKAVLNANLTINSNTVICELHWPPNFEVVKVRGGKIRPKNPPSVWPNVPLSQIPTASAPGRTTTRTSSNVRNVKNDELEAFLLKDQVSFSTLKEELTCKNKKLQFAVLSFVVDDKLVIQSVNFEIGIPLFVINIFEDLHFEAYHCGIATHISTLSSNRITFVSSWSILDEIVRFLNSKESDNKKKVILQQISAMRTRCIGEKLYSPEMIIRAFSYFTISRALYRRLRTDFQLPSTSTLTKITSKVSKLDEGKYLDVAFRDLNEEQKLCIIFHDEIYLKKMLLYHGGTIFGRAEDNPADLAKTMLGIMIYCLNGGPKILAKIIPVSKLESNFLFHQVDALAQFVNAAGTKVKAIICDGNRVNQAYFKLHNTIPGKPWLTVNDIYLLFDYVHLLKNIRNLWLTEKTGELLFYDNGIAKIAKWIHLQKLFELERGNLVKLSDLNEMSIAPKPIERQRVSTCLKVFSEKTHTALLTHPLLDQNEVKDTAAFIYKVLRWWKILNVRSCETSVRRNDQLLGAISDPQDKRLTFLLEFGDMAKKMAGKQRSRVKQLSKDTAFAIHQTCHGIVELSRHLLETSHKYVLLGQFTSDHLEKQFSKLRQGSGGAYFLTVQQIVEKVRIKNASLLLKSGVDLDKLSVQSGHKCASCLYKLSEEDEEIFDGLPDLEEFIPIDVKMSLVHIAGYVTRNDAQLSEKDLLDHTTFYYQKFGRFTQFLDRGGLKIPTDRSCQWVFFCFALFHAVKRNACRKSLANFFELVSEFYGFAMTGQHCIVLSNIFLNQFCRKNTPRLGKEPALKLLKLS